MRSAARSIAVAALATVMLNACGNRTPSAPTAVTPAPVPPVGSVNLALIGTWSGNLEGSFGACCFHHDPRR